MGAGGEETVEKEAELRQTAPGRYEAAIPLEAHGSILLSARHRKDGRVVAESFAEASSPYPEEFAQLEPNTELLRRAAELTGGIVDPEPAAVFDPGEDVIEGVALHWPDFALAALVLWLLDILVRRVRWPGA